MEAAAQAAEISASRSDEAGWGLGLRQSRIFACVVFPLYLLLTWKTIGLRPEHVFVAAVFMALFSATPRTARFAAMAIPFLLVGILYDNLRLVLGVRGAIHVADIYEAELRLFSVSTPHGPKILPEYFNQHSSPILDFFCGFAYLAYLGESFILGVYLFFRDQKQLSRFAWAFFLVNLLGMITYLVFPAAPPWYVEKYGLGQAIMDAKPSAAGAARFDELLGVGYFAAFYSRNANVFGAMPSLHCAYPTIVALATRKLGKAFFIPAVAFAFLVAFSAVYLSHHYVLDVIAGVLYGGTALGIVTLLMRKR